MERTPTQSPAKNIPQRNSNSAKSSPSLRNLSTNKNNNNNTTTINNNNNSNNNPSNNTINNNNDTASEETYFIKHKSLSASTSPTSYSAFKSRYGYDNNNIDKNCSLN